MGNNEAVRDQVLIAIRRIVRAIDLHSRRLVQEHGITGPQALILKRLADSGELSAGELARAVSLSQATVTDVLDRLEKRGLLRRERSAEDKRRVLVSATAQGLDVLKSSPPLLQDHFVAEFARLADWEQSLILSSLQRVAAMMDATELDVAPLLAGPVVE